MSSVQLPCHGGQTSEPAQHQRSLHRKQVLVSAVYANGQRLPREPSLETTSRRVRLHGDHTVPVFVSSGLVDPALPHLSNVQW